MIFGRLIGQVNTKFCFSIYLELLVRKVGIPGFIQLSEDLVFEEFPRLLFMYSKKSNP